ncbi:hypothetical protein JTB14_006361 [Gonioctena quinquepunctata]|nr:hypothetical protein JTB14_006361 [Gonioctena quinquepunctata]
MSQVIHENDITNKDLFNMMKNVLSTNETIEKQNVEIKIELCNMKQELSSQIEELKEENTYLKEEVEKLKAGVLISGRKQKKYNLFFYIQFERRGKPASRHTEYY